MAGLYATIEEERLHWHAMQDLAVETGLALERVRTTWEHELAPLAAGARIRDYLLIFARRRTREALAAQASAPAAAAAQPRSPGARPMRAAVPGPRTWPWRHALVRRDGEPPRARVP